MVTLLHGTWASGAPWTSHDSTLCRAISQRLPDTVFRQYRWSGRNGVGARTRAALRLQEHIRELTDEYPGAKKFLIAHSHAGNIVFYALRDPELARQIDGVICISTPFIHVSARRESPATLMPLIVVLMSAIFIAGMLLLDLLLPQLPDIPKILMAFAPTLLAAPLLYHWNRMADQLREQMTLGGFDPERLLLLRMSGDEASAALSSAQFFGWVLTWVQDRTSDLVSYLHSRLDGYEDSRLATLIPIGAVGTVLLTVLHAWIGSSLHPEIQAVLRILLIVCTAGFVIVMLPGWIVAAVTVTLTLAIAPMLALTWLLLLPFGAKLVLAAPFLDVSVEPTPPGVYPVEHFPPEEPQPSESAPSGLRHSFGYQDRRAIDRIATWLQRRSDSPSSVSQNRP